MTPEFALELMHFTLMTAAKLAAPYMISSVGIGVIMNILQTVTGLKDQSLTFIPKLVGVAAVVLLSLPWEMNVMMAYFDYIIDLFGTV